MCQERYMNEMSKGFEVKIGLRQRDVLSPVLFNLTLEQAVRDYRSMEIVGNMALLTHADDLVILDEFQDQIISRTYT